MKYILIIFPILFSHLAHAQMDSIFDQGMYRTFILHLPASYDENVDYPLVFNFHGLGSNAFEQLLYSQFDAIADAKNFIVVYPDAVNNNWDLFGNTDLNFISNLVDTIRLRYSTNSCLLFMGMSQGGFLSYKFACEFPKPVTAIAVVTGNMTDPLQNSCNTSNGMPVMHFHGTADNVVLYNGSLGVPPVEETIQWWATENNCNENPDITSLPDINIIDGSTVEKYFYNDCSGNNEVILYKITGGGHTWPGAFPIPSLGNTNQDIDGSELIGNFFAYHCALFTGINITHAEDIFLIYPNPASQSFTIHAAGNWSDASVYDFQGRKLQTVVYAAENPEIDCSDYPDGIYLIRVRMDDAKIFDRIILKIHH